MNLLWTVTVLITSIVANNDEQRRTIFDSRKTFDVENLAKGLNTMADQTFNDKHFAVIQLSSFDPSNPEQSFGLSFLIQSKDSARSEQEWEFMATRITLFKLASSTDEGTTNMWKSHNSVHAENNKPAVVTIDSPHGTSDAATTGLVTELA